MLERSEMPQTHMNMALLNLCLVKMGEQIVWQDGYVYSKKAWDEETSLLYHLKRLQKPVKRYVVTEVEEIEQKLGITYTEGRDGLPGDRRERGEDPDRAAWSGKERCHPGPYTRIYGKVQTERNDRQSGTGIERVL